MNLELWRLFYEVAVTKSFSATSKKLHISQPAITKQIKNLENQLNCKLFIRTQKGVTLTQEGECIFGSIKIGLNAFELAEKKISEVNNIITGTIRLGVSTTMTKTFLMPYIKQFHKLHPNIVFEISTDPTSTLKEELKKGKIDFIVAKFPPKITDDLKYTKIGPMQDIFVVSKDCKELINKELKIEEVLKYPTLLQKRPSSSREYIEKFCEENHYNLHSIMEIASSNLLIEFAKIGYGIGVVTKEYVRNELKRKELYELNVTPEIPKRNFGIISLKNNYLSKGCTEFLNILLKIESDDKNDYDRGPKE